MKIYKLTINRVQDDPQFVVSSYIAPRTTHSEEYFLTEELAKVRQSEIYDGLQKLIGFIPKIEAFIKEIEVKEK